jgi:hypothetical protein
MIRKRSYKIRRSHKKRKSTYTSSYRKINKKYQLGGTTPSVINDLIDKSHLLPELEQYADEMTVEQTNKLLERIIDKRFTVILSVPDTLLTNIPNNIFSFLQWLYGVLLIPWDLSDKQKVIEDVNHNQLYSMKISQFIDLLDTIDAIKLKSILLLTREHGIQDDLFFYWLYLSLDITDATIQTGEWTISQPDLLSRINIVKSCILHKIQIINVIVISEDISRVSKILRNIHIFNHMIEKLKDMIFDQRYNYKGKTKSTILTKIYHTLPIHRIDITLSDITFTEDRAKFTMNGINYTFRGKGGYGAVYVNDDNTEAIKIISRQGILYNASELTNREIFDYFNISSLICDKEDDGTFCKFINAYYKQVRLLQYDLYIRMEYCGENLWVIVSNQVTIDQLTINILLKWFITIAKGIRCMHAKNYVHLDIKPDNITIVGDLRNLSQCHAKIIDFGLSRNIDTIRDGLSVGTKRYKAPEMDYMYGQEGDDYKGYDIYSLGVTFWDCLHKILTTLELSVKDMIKDMIKEMLNEDYSKRINIDKVIQILTTILDGVPTTILDDGPPTTIHDGPSHTKKAKI